MREVGGGVEGDRGTESDEEREDRRELVEEEWRRRVGQERVRDEVQCEGKDLAGL